MKPPRRVFPTIRHAPPPTTTGVQPSRTGAPFGVPRWKEHTGSLALRLISALLLFAILFLRPVNTAPADVANAADALMRTLHERGQFDGSIMVARGGNVIYRNAFGWADSEARRRLTPEIPSNLASVSKQFTAMLVMILSERGKIHYDDPVSQYLPKLEGRLPGVTIRHLLTHTSGIPDVGDLGIDHPGLTEQEILNAIIKQHSQFPKPGQAYRYSNTGYNLLAMVVEQAAGKSFGDCLREDIFGPLGMDHTFSDDESAGKLRFAAAGYDPYGNIDTPRAQAGRDSVKGDGGIYSTVDDLLKWDQALSRDKLVRRSTLAEAFVPGKVREGVSTYGFAWNIAYRGGDKYVWHTGSTGGFRAFIGRRLGEKLTVIMLTNKGNSQRMEINEAIVNILHGKTFALPKLPVAPKIYALIKERGIEAARRMYDSVKTTHRADYELTESALNSLGYKLLSEGDKESGMRVFEWNTADHPSSSNAFDSLGEAYLAAGKKKLAAGAYRKAVELDPHNLNARNMLRSLE